jgi:hypothetical protein
LARGVSSPAKREEDLDGLDRLAEEVLVRSEDAGTVVPREARFAIALEVFSMATKAMDRRLAREREAAGMGAGAVVVVEGDLVSRRYGEEEGGSGS